MPKISASVVNSNTRVVRLDNRMSRHPNAQAIIAASTLTTIKTGIVVFWNPAACATASDVLAVPSMTAAAVKT